MQKLVQPQVRDMRVWLTQECRRRVVVLIRVEWQTPVRVEGEVC